MQIQHIGKVVAIAPGAIVVSIDSMSECSGCGARLLCNRDTSKSQLTVRTEDAPEYSVGDTVRVSTVEASQDRAVRIGILYPCLLLLASAAILLLSGASQTVTALGAVGSVAVYYGILYLVSRKLNDMFRWTVHKLN